MSVELTNPFPPVGRPHRLPVHHCQLHTRLGKMVAEPGKRGTLPIHGQGQ